MARDHAPGDRVTAPEVARVPTPPAPSGPRSRRTSGSPFPRAVHMLSPETGVAPVSTNFGIDSQDASAPEAAAGSQSNIGSGTVPGGTSVGQTVNRAGAEVGSRAHARDARRACGGAAPLASYFGPMGAVRALTGPPGSRRASGTARSTTATAGDASRPGRAAPTSCGTAVAANAYKEPQ